MRPGRGSLLLLFVLGANFCPQPTTGNQTTDLSTANLTAIFDAAIKRVQDTHAFISLSFVLLTAPHVACTSPAHSNTMGTSRKGTSQPREHIVALGNIMMGYQHATSGIMAALDQLAQPLSITPFHGCGGY